MGLINRFAEASRQLAEEAQGKTGFWDSIMPRIKQGIVIPVISSSFRIEQIFNSAVEVPSDEDGRLTIHEQLVAAWADFVKYPMLDKGNLARVTQYVLVEQKKEDDLLLARTKYFDYLKNILVNMSGKDPNFADLVNTMKGRTQGLRFSEVVQKLEYPRFASDTEDPLRLLAKLPLKYYITTSQSDFLERALEAEEKKPVTQICFWSGEVENVVGDHQTDPKFKPNDTTPLVYHLYGLEDYPQTLVLSEDDYINFLISIMGDTDATNPKVPLSLRNAIKSSQLILLGYKLTDWDFRVLFRILLKYRTDEYVPRGMLIQLQKNEKVIEDLDNSIEYLDKYFDKNKFGIEWSSTEAFIQRLWNDWNTYRNAGNTSGDGQP